MIDVDCGALRDRGWHLYPSNAIPFEDDPIEGTTETVTTGFYIRDGIKGHIVEGTRRAERGRDGRVLLQVIDCVDEYGRALHAVGQSLNWLKWPHNSDILNWWSLVKWEYDGQVAYGEDQDFMTFRHYRRYRRRLLENDPGLLQCFPPSLVSGRYRLSSGSHRRNPVHDNMNRRRRSFRKHR